MEKYKPKYTRDELERITGARIELLMSHDVDIYSFKQFIVEIGRLEEKIKALEKRMDTVEEIQAGEDI